MEVGTLSLTVEEKQPGSESNEQPEGAGKEPAPKGPNQGPIPDAKAKDAKPAPERKRTRNLTEDRRFKLFSGTANRPLAEEIARHIGVQVGEAKLQRFADGEVYFQLLENVRGVALGQNEAVQRPYRKLVENDEGQRVLGDRRERRGIAKRT